MIIFKRKEVEKREFKIPYRVSVPNIERCNSFRREEKEGNESFSTWRQFNPGTEKWKEK